MALTRNPSRQQYVTCNLRSKHRHTQQSIVSATFRYTAAPSNPHFTSPGCPSSVQTCKRTHAHTDTHKRTHQIQGVHNELFLDGLIQWAINAKRGRMIDLQEPRTQIIVQHDVITETRNRLHESMRLVCIYHEISGVPRQAWWPENQITLSKPGGFYFSWRARRSVYSFFGRHVYFLGWTPLRDHPPPQPPVQCSHPDKKGTNLLLFGFCIHLHTQDLKLKCCRVMGQKLRHGRPCTHDLPGTHNWLAQPHIDSISSNLTISCWHNPGSLV